MEGNWFLIIFKEISIFIIHNTYIHICIYILYNQSGLIFAWTHNIIYHISFWVGNFTSHFSNIYIF